MSKNLKIVLFALVKDKKILLEKRPVPGFLKDQYLIPGGAVNPEEDLKEALKREMLEELAVIPSEFKLLIKVNEDIQGLFGNILYPFVVTKWKGNIPKFILDRDDPYLLEWIEIEEALNIPIESTKKIVTALKKYLERSKTINFGIKS